MRVAISGSTGLIGRALIDALTARGDTPIPMVRRSGERGSIVRDEIRYDPTGDALDPQVFADVDAVVNLAGAPIGDKRWNPARREVLRASRIGTTSVLSTAIAQHGPRLRFVSGSATGYYGDRGDTELTEASGPGGGFLADLVRDWEAATLAASDAGVPVALARTGLVLTGKGGALGPLLPLARLGLAGPLGDGRAYWPWISLADEVGALLHLLDNPGIQGPVNLTAPEPATVAQIVRTLGRALRRPAVLPVPRIALRLAIGEFADEILASQRIVGVALADSGYSFRHAHLADAIAAAVQPDTGDAT